MGYQKSVFLSIFVMFVLKWAGTGEGTHCKNVEQHLGFPKVVHILCFAYFRLTLFLCRWVCFHLFMQSYLSGGFISVWLRTMNNILSPVFIQLIFTQMLFISPEYQVQWLCFSSRVCFLQNKVKSYRNCEVGSCSLLCICWRLH